MPDIAQLSVRLHGAEIGTLTRLPGDRILFAFDEGYIADEARPTLSLSFRDVLGELITDIRPTRTRLPPFFANLLPEGRMRDYLAARAGVDPNREFFLLWVLGRDLPGALEIHPAEGAAWPPDAGPGGRGDARGGGRDLDEAEGDEPALRFSLAGVQLKFSAVEGARAGLTIPADGVGGSWIVKLPSSVHRGVPENEYAMMELARRIGIDVPETALVPIESIAGLPRGIERAGPQAFAIKRFDRTDDGKGDGGGRVHMEDLAQVFGVYPERKYARASTRNVAEVIWAEIGEAGIAAFLKRFVFNALIGNGDLHLKNWSLVYPDRRRAALAPAYDFVSTVPYIPGDKLALGFAGTKDFAALDLDRIKRFAAKARLPEKLALDTAQETLDRFAEAWRNKDDPPVDRKLRTAIGKHLKTIPLWKVR